MKKNKQIIKIIILILLAIGMYIALMFTYDWHKYSSQNNKIKSYIESLQGVDKNTVASDNYCTYSHQKYSKGILGCNLTYTFSTLGGEISFKNSQLLNKLDWKYKFDNTKSINKYDNKNYLKHVVFETKDMTCSYSIISGDKYELECSGPAKAEWFPVRDN